MHKALRTTLLLKVKKCTFIHSLHSTVATEGELRFFRRGRARGQATLSLGHWHLKAGELHFSAVTNIYLGLIAK